MTLFADGSQPYHALSDRNAGLVVAYLCGVARVGRDTDLAGALFEALAAAAGAPFPIAVSQADRRELAALTRSRNAKLAVAR